MKAPSRNAGLPAILVVSIGALLGGCATPPKPPELEAFEKMRADPQVQAAAKLSPDQGSGAEQLFRRAREEWQDNELMLSRNSALLGQVKLKHAMALAEQDQARKRIAAAEAELKTTGDEYARLQRDLGALNEQLALLRRLHETTQQLGAEQKKGQEERLRAGATDRIADAELALKTAETVRAAVHAKLPFTVATENLERARQELAAGNFPSAQASAEMAKLKANEAAAAAKPIYERESQAEENKARAEALARDAAAIPGVVVRREARGSLQRLVVPLDAERLFVRRATTIGPDKEAVLQPVAELLKKYPTFPVQIVGYTDNRGRAGEQLAFSLARAESVFSTLVLRGVDAKRVVVSGQGAAEPVADNRTAAGRAKNNRVEIVFLYQ